jgi:hypothetical protein
MLSLELGITEAAALPFRRQFYTIPHDAQICVGGNWRI